MEVTLINRPTYIVDFAQFLPGREKRVELQLHQTIYNIAVGLIQFVGVVISSVFNAAYLTLRYSITSFVRLVFDSFGITDFYLAAFKIGYWAFSMGFTFTATTGRLIMNAYSFSNELYIRQFIKGGIDPRHIQTKGIKLDASEVPAEVKVESLLDLYDQINFTHPDDPGYMAPTTRQERRDPYSAEDLRKNLEKFIKHVDGRVAYVGTPLAHDTVCLNAFYMQIEDAVRLSIHKATDDLKSFILSNPDAATSEDPEIIRQYKNLLEDRARLVIDLAIAGKHCGARYMGEAMSSYFSLYGDAEPTGTLADTLIELLAAKRNQVAQGQIQQYFGTSTHGFSRYMQNMGGLLAIPGTENIIEHLSSQSFDTATYLTSFFRIYNEDCIIDTIQERIKKSQAFREQIINWLKERVSEDWKPEDTPDQRTLVEELNELIDQHIDTTPMENDIQILIELLAYLKEKDVALPELDEGWNNFVQNLFVLSESKEWFNNMFAAQEMIARLRKRQTLVQKLSTGVLGKVLGTQYIEQQDIILNEGIIKNLERLTIVEKLKGHVMINEETIIRVLEGKVDLDKVIGNYLMKPRQSQFLAALNIEEMKENGLSPVMMEWLLDFHQIFVPKNLEKADISGIDVDTSSAADYIGVVDMDGYDFQIRTSDLEVVRDVFLPLLKEDYATHGGKRYIFGAETDIEEVRNRIFEIAFKERPESVIRAAEKALPANASLYPLWKRDIYIKAPEIGAAIFGNTILKVVISAYLTFKLVKLTKQAYEQSGIWANRAHRYLTKETSPQVTAAYRSAFKAYSWVLEHKWRLFIYEMIAQYALNEIPHPLARRLAGRINPFSIIFWARGSYFLILFDMVYDSLTFGWKTSSNISSTLQSFADQSKQERLGISKKHCYSLWNKAIAVII